MSAFRRLLVVLVVLALASILVFVLAVDHAAEFPALQAAKDEHQDEREVDQHLVSVMRLPTNNSWTPPAVRFANSYNKPGLFGTLLAAPVGSSSDPWCQVELMATHAHTQTFSPDCRQDTVRQGNISSMRDQFRYRDFQFHNRSVHLTITDAETNAYWEQNRDPLTASCSMCAGGMLHRPVYRARRWWAVVGWTKRSLAPEGQAERSRATFLLLHRDRLEGRYAYIAGHFAAYNKSAPPAESIRFAEVSRIVYCEGGANSISHLRVESNTGAWLHYLRFIASYASFLSFSRSLQILLPSLFSSAFFVESGDCSVETWGKSGAALDSRRPRARGAVPEITMPYIPCHRFGIDEIAQNALSNQALDDDRKKLKMFTMWPFTCDALRDASGCKQEQEVRSRSMQVDQTIRVAVAISGFVRSYASARSAIDTNIVQPHNAVLFGCTWNVVGRTKKTATVKKEQTVSVAKMFKTIAGFMNISPSENVTRLEVLSYFRLLKTLDVVRLGGFQQPGLYFTVAKVMQLVVNSKISFDIVIRTRFDVFPAVPFRFTRMRTVDDVPAHGPYEYALNLGSSCLMDGMWWPQWARFGDGKLLKHYADTRMKYFSWQVCDWIEIGTFRTMSVTARLYDWVQENNVFSAAQFVEHAFYVDQNISYQPLQLYLKIMRHKGHFFG